MSEKSDPTSPLFFFSWQAWDNAFLSPSTGFFIEFYDELSYYVGPEVPKVWCDSASVSGANGDTMPQ